MNSPTVRCQILDTGYCLASESMMIRGGRHQTVACHALVALLHHPQHGWLLWDTGYAPHMLAETTRLPFRLYRVMTPLRLRPELAVAAQLVHFGLEPANIGTIIISHFHADHVAGMRDFPRARFMVARSAYADFAHRRGLNALRRGYVPALVPADFAARAQLLEPFSGEALPGLGPTHDIFGDGSLLLVELPGHARGQLGLLATTERGRVLFAADGAWMRRAIRERRVPHAITRLLVDDMRAVRTTLERLHAFAAACPDVTIVPTHCPEAYAELCGG